MLKEVYKNNNSISNKLKRKPMYKSAPLSNAKRYQITYKCDLRKVICEIYSNYIFLVLKVAKDLTTTRIYYKIEVQGGNKNVNRWIRDYMCEKEQKNKHYYIDHKTWRKL